MSIFSVSSCMLEKPKGEKCYITGVLHKFTEQTNKVAVDNGGKILDIYKNKAKDDPNIAYWLNIMTMVPSSFESVCNIPDDKSVDLMEIFIFLASQIPCNPRLIVYSTTIFKDKFILDKKSRIKYEEKNIKVFDRDKAYDHFNKKKSKIKSSIKHSIVAKGGSKIKEVEK